MINMILADLERILKKKSFWIVFLIPCVIAAFYGAAVLFDEWDGLEYAAAQIKTFSLLGNMILGISVFLGVYADEFRSKSMQAMIGRGISRTRIVLVKFLDCVLLTMIAYGVFALLLFVMSLFGGGMTPFESRAMYLTVVFSGLKTIGFSTIATIVLYLTGNVPIAVIVDVILYMLSTLLALFAAVNDFLHKTHPERLLYEGVMNRIYTSIMLDLPPGLLVCLAAVFYVFLAILISAVIFRKKELEF